MKAEIEYIEDRVGALEYENDVLKRELADLKARIKWLEAKTRQQDRDIALACL